MALLDVTADVLFDPMFMDDIVVIRSQRTVNAQGLTVDIPGSYYSTGCVQPSRGADLNVLPEAERVGAFVTVVTMFRLITASDATGPDQIVWNGKSYRVVHVEDWSRYGAGFVQAVCQLTSITPDQSPTLSP